MLLDKKMKRTEGKIKCLKLEKVKRKKGFRMTTLVDDEEILSKIMKYNTR